MAETQKGFQVIGGVRIVDTLESLQQTRSDLTDLVNLRDSMLVDVVRALVKIRRGLGKLKREDVDAQLKAVIETASRPWARHLQCGVCGARAIQTRAESGGRQSKMRTVIEHPGGRFCRAPCATPEDPNPSWAPTVH